MKAMTNLESILKTEISLCQQKSTQSYGFSSSNLRMWELDHEEGWALKKWYFWAVVLEKTLESALDSKEIQPVSPKGNQPWIFIGRTDAEASVLWLSDMKNWFTGKDLNAGKDWGRRRRGQQRVKWLDGLANSMDMNLSKLQERMEDRGTSYSPWGCKDSDRTEWVNYNNAQLSRL